MVRTLLIMTVILSLAGAVFAQPAAAGPAFEVASVKPSPPGNTRDSGGVGRMNFLPGGRFTATNAAVNDLMVVAYGVQDWQISGGPKWVNPSIMVTDDRYNIDARSAGEASRDQVRLMLQALLADRFKLALHREAKDSKAYALSVAKNNPKLQEVKNDNYAGSKARSGGGRLVAEEMTMAELADYLTGYTQAPVSDKTALKGIYKFELVWTPESFRIPGVGAAPSSENAAGIDPNGPTLATALHEQLGLRLDPQKRSVEILVIDHVEKPSEN